MFRARDPQKSLFSARNQYRDALDDDSFYALLADHAEELFDDYQFEYLYVEDNGRPCIPPGQMFTLLLLQMHDGCSDGEAVERARFDIRWAAALDMEPTLKLCGRSTLQEFRARVLLHEVAEEQFKSTLALARKLGVIKGPLKVAMDTTPVFGRGAVKDTYNLIGDGIRKVAQVLARVQGVSSEQWASQHDFGRYWNASSLKGEAGIDWSDETQRRVFLNSLVADAERILLLADLAAKKAVEYAPELTEASALLRRIIIQDTEPDPDPQERASMKSSSVQDEANTEPTSVDGSETCPDLLSEMVRIRKGTATERIISVHDPEIRHGRKSSSTLFNGYKLSIVNDVESGLILSLDILSGGAGDNEGAFELVVQAQQNTGLRVTKAIADCAYGDGPTRQKFHDTDIDLSAKVPADRKNIRFPKSRFKLDLTNMIATCPAGKTSSVIDYRSRSEYDQPIRRLRFRAEDCADCSNREDCLRNSDKRSSWGRGLELHPQEELLQQARQHQASPEFRDDIRSRQTAEQRLARCIQLGARQARYFGKRKTKFQMTMIALLANLRVVQATLGGIRALAFTTAEWVGLLNPAFRADSKENGKVIAIRIPRLSILRRVS